MIVKLKSKNPSYPDLSEDQPYFVIEIEADDYRILNDAGRPYLYPPELFEVIDSQHSPDWVTEFGDEGEQYSYPTPRLLNLANFNQHLFMHESYRCRCVLRTKACLISAAKLHEENLEELVQIQQPTPHH